VSAARWQLTLRAYPVRSCPFGHISAPKLLIQRSTEEGRPAPGVGRIATGKSALRIGVLWL
jgi:hypothetical protein